MKKSKSVQFMAGMVLVFTGIVLILACWSEVAALFRGAVGIVFALAGMVLLYMAGSD